MQSANHRPSTSGSGTPTQRAHAGVRVQRFAFIVCIALGLVASSVASAIPITNLVISEIMYEPSGGDNGKQWVEIYNGTGSTFDLSDFRLEWGRTSLDDSVTLSGTLAPDSIFLIGGPTSNGTNGNPIFDQVFNFNPNLGDGGHPWQEDALALVQISTSTLLHIVVYGGNGIAVPFLDEQGATAVAVDDSSLGNGDSLEYLGGGAWQVQTTPTANVQHSNLSVIPEPTSALLIGLGLVALGIRPPTRSRRA